MDGLSVAGIRKLQEDGQIVSDCARDWDTNVKTIYRVLNEVKKVWHGEFAKKYTDPVEEIQPDFVDFGNVLNYLACKVINIGRMFQATEEFGDVSQAKLEEPEKFDLTDVINAASNSEVEFNSTIIKDKAKKKKNAAKEVERVIDIVDGKKNDIASNYVSDGATEIVGKITKMKDSAPEYIRIINECADTLINVVVPQYSTIEKYAGDPNA